MFFSRRKNRNIILSLIALNGSMFLSEYEKYILTFAVSGTTRSVRQIMKTTAQQIPSKKNFYDKFKLHSIFKLWLSRDIENKFLSA